MENTFCVGIYSYDYAELYETKVDLCLCLSWNHKQNVWVTALVITSIFK